MIIHIEKNPNEIKVLTLGAAVIMLVIVQGAQPPVKFPTNLHFQPPRTGARQSMNRRQLLRTTGFGLVAGAVGEAVNLSASTGGDPKSQPMPLSLAEYEPQSMLQVRQMHVD